MLSILRRRIEIYSHRSLLCIDVSAKLSTSLSKQKEFSVENEPIYEYLRGSNERKQLESALQRYKGSCIEVPIIIDGQPIKTSQVKYQVSPFDHNTKIAKFYWATEEVIRDAITKSQSRREEWEKVPMDEKINIFLRAADLVSDKYRYDLNATTILGQSKTFIQAEIDAAAELADFFRFNAYFAKELCKYQPVSTNPREVKNSFRHRGLEGFVASVSPFNFTAIGGNLASAPAMMGNVVLWKPSDTALLSNYIVFQILQEAGFPPGVINFIPCDGPLFGNTTTSSPDFAGLNFTGSVPTFRHLWKQVSNNLDIYKNFPRLVGECGGKNFHFVHSSANVDTVIAATIRSAFEYGGQKCSACSRMYVPKSLWHKIKDGLLSIRNEVKLGSPLEHETYFSAVIDGKAFERNSNYIKHAKSSSSLSILGGGKCDDSVGYYIEPTIIETTDPLDRIMKEEIFGPILAIYAYPDSELNEAMDLVRTTSGYALTGAIFAQDENFISEAKEKLKMAAGNFYVNDKCTGSVVGQQPFGGSRLSGTNDKAGGPHYLLRWSSPQVVKETFIPVTEWQYKYMTN